MMQPSQPSQVGSAEAGFTLLEVLVALAILGVSLATLLGVFGASLDRDQRIAQRMAVRTLAQSLLAQAETDTTFVSGTKSGQSADGVGWRMTARPLSADSDQTMLTQIDVTVESGNKPSLQLTTVRLSGTDLTP
jgi:general secretion pathway protein I